MQALKVRGIEPFSADISITDKQLIHLSRAVKQARGQQVDLNTIKHLPDRLANADVVLLNVNDKELVYAFKRSDGFIDKLSVKLEDEDKRGKGMKTRNWLTTAGKVEKYNLAEKKYQVVKGEL